MAPPTVAQSIALYVAGSGGSPAGNEATLAIAVRERLNQKFDQFARTTTKVAAFLFGMEPILDYLKASFSGQRIKALTREELGQRVHRIFELVAHRTKLADKYSAVLESSDEWHAVEAGLQMQLSGKAARPPATSPSLTSRAWHPSAAFVAPWWSGRRAVSIFLFIYVVLIYQLKHLLEVSRHRVYVYFFCFFLFGSGVAYWFLGPDVLPNFLLKFFDKATEEVVPDPQSEATSEASDDDPVSDGWTPPEPESAPAEASGDAAKVDKLANEMSEIRALVLSLKESSPAPAGAPTLPVSADSPVRPPTNSGQMQALFNFATDQPTTGPISETGARQLAPGLTDPASPVPAAPISLDAALSPPGAPMPVTQPNAWSPLTNPRRSAIQAGILFDRLNQWSGQKSTNPWWGVNFWQEVGKLEHEQTLEPDLLRVLRGYGYCGAHTLGAPRDSLVGALQGLRDAGAVPAGNPGFPSAPPGLNDSVAMTSDARWQQGLPPDLKRAAPEIYRACRAEGANNLREWINLRFQGEKSNRNPTWTHVWHTATECDFAILRVGSGNEMALLASDDGLEMKLRELASYVHFWRTGDLTSSTNMLAVKPPGTETDVAPAWLVDESTTFSKAEFQRSQRVKQKGKGKGRGRGKGDKSQGSPGKGSPGGGK